MAGTYPPAGAAAGYFPAYNLSGWAGTPTTSATLLTIKSGSHPAYFYAYKSCTIYQMSASVVGTNSTACTLTLQPWGSSASGGTAAAMGSSGQISVPTSGAFVSYNFAENFTLAVGGYVGISLTSSVSNSAVWINICLWASQAGA